MSKYQIIVFVGLFVVSAAAFALTQKQLAVLSSPMNHDSQGNVVASSEPVLHDAQGNVVTKETKNNSYQPVLFKNKKYMYQIAVSNIQEMETDSSQGYGHDNFYCLSIYVIPSQLVNTKLDKTIFFPLSSIKELSALPVDSAKDFFTGKKEGDIAIKHTYTRLQDTWLGTQKATVFEFSNNWEMLGNTRIFYTKKNNLNYIVMADYNGVCENDSALKMIDSFEFIEPEATPLPQ
jgi:hypothetical protein